MAAANTVGEERVRRIPVEELPEHLATLEEELQGGRAIELVRGERVVAELRAPLEPLQDGAVRSRPIPDFMARLREIYGNAPLDSDSTALIREDRDARG